MSLKYYRIAPQNRVPSTFLTYSSQTPLKVGQLVIVGLRKTEVVGLVMEEIEQVDFDTKEVIRVLPIVLPQATLEFIQLFWYNTLNDYNAIISVFGSQAVSLSHKNLSELTTGLDTRVSPPAKIVSQDLKKKHSNNVVYSIHKSQWLRIRIIIRTYIRSEESDQNSDIKTILITVPEIALLRIYEDHIREEFNDQITILTYRGDKSASSRSTYVCVLNQEFLPNTPTLRIILSTRAGVFLPFESLDHIIVIDEANSLYIQEQNSLYFDTRDALYLLSYVHLCKIEFISDLPSARLLQINPKQAKIDLSSNYINDASQRPRMQIYKRERKDTFSDIFSAQILEDIDVEYLED